MKETGGDPDSSRPTLSAGDPPDQVQWPWLMAGSLSTSEKLESSAVRELLALRQAIANLEADGWLTEPTTVVWSSDSTAATRALLRWRSGSTKLAGLLTDL
jgi:hypothetical protein